MHPPLHPPGTAQGSPSVHHEHLERRGGHTEREESENILVRFRVLLNQHRKRGRARLAPKQTRPVSPYLWLQSFQLAGRK